MFAQAFSCVPILMGTGGSITQDDGMAYKKLFYDPIGYDFIEEPEIEKETKFLGNIEK